MTGLTIEGIAPGSVAERAGLQPGERLLAIDGQRVRDLIDYSWLISYDQAELTVSDQTGHQRSVWLDPEPGEPLGLAFAPPEPKRCGNNCLFCFVHQLPKGLRRPLYVKDEDYRLSFLQGTYVTLTNLKESELRRIIRLRLSPLYISVHTTDPALRERMLGRSGIPPILEQLTRLAEARIQMHTQVVLCPGLNDGPALEQTVEDLAALYPAVQSLAVVPVGLTSHRQRLPLLTAVDEGYAAAFVAEWLPRMRALNKRLQAPFLQLADEFFLKGGQDFPDLREYGDLPQWENGVGMVPWFQHQAAKVIKRAKPLSRPVRATLVTGRSANGFVADFSRALAEKTGAELLVRPIPNRLFGESVTVSGLVSGADIIAALAGQNLGELVLLPGVMLKEGEGCFLDNLTLRDLRQALGLPVLSFDGTPSGLYTALRRYAARKAATTHHTKQRRTTP